MSSAKSIVLIGFMGTGKSSVGRILETKTGLHRFDTDEMVSSKLNLSIQEIFSKHGEGKFREAETEALQSLAGQESAIIVTGGGIVTKGKNIDLLKSLGTVVWLDADHATLHARMDQLKDRPLLQTANPVAALSELLHTRNPLYRNTADIRVDISQRTHDEIADLILKNIRNFPIGE
jgi:shikimate kinase